MSDRLSDGQVQRAIELAEPDKPTFDPANITAALARGVQELRAKLERIKAQVDAWHADDQRWPGDYMVEIQEVFYGEEEEDYHTRF